MASRSVKMVSFTNDHAGYEKLIRWTSQMQKSMNTQVIFGMDRNGNDRILWDAAGPVLQDHNHDGRRIDTPPRTAYESSISSVLILVWKAWEPYWPGCVSVEEAWHERNASILVVCEASAGLFFGRFGPDDRSDEILSVNYTMMPTGSVTVVLSSWLKRRG